MQIAESSSSDQKLLLVGAHWKGRGHVIHANQKPAWLSVFLGERYTQGKIVCQKWSQEQIPVRGFSGVAVVVPVRFFESGLRGKVLPSW